jgi:outer membrane receptor for ferrienterochelin and colicins
MAGVINIITEKPSTRKVAVQLQYAANRTVSAAVNYSERIKKTAVQLFANRYSTSGYDLDKNIYGKTVDPFTDHSFGLKLTQYLSTNSQLVLSARYFDETQKNNYLVTDQSAPQTVTGTTKEKDWGVNLQHIQQLSKSSKLTTRLYFNQYTNNSDVFLKNNNERYDALRFFQRMLKPEVQYEKSAGQLKYTSGMGMLLESVDASRYDSKHDFTTFYVYTQEEWTFAKGYNLIAGVRGDKRNDFDLRVSPKVALGAQVTDKLFLNLSAGLGYRTPDVRQMYALFTNSSVGYTLLGTNVLRSGLEKLKAEGQIDRAADISSYSDKTILKAETSTGLNVGLRYTPGARLVFQANIFRNDLKNLIDRFTLPFNKNNGQSIYSYRNVSRVYTEGISGDVSWKINSYITASAGYQFLNAKDKDVINGIRKNRYLKRDQVTYRTDTVRLGDYGGLLNRSKNSANLKIMYTNEKSGASGWVRANYTGRYGYTEKNGSGILDDASEYQRGFFLCNLTISKRIMKNMEVQSGIDNLLNYKNPSLMPNLAGRIYFVNVNIDIDKF